MRTPEFPRTDTLQARALCRLLSGKKFTHREFQEETQTYKLAAIVDVLRNKRGWIIDSPLEKGLTSGKIRRQVAYARYSIEPEIIAEYRKMLGERLDNFMEAVRKFESAPWTRNQGAEK